MPDGLSPATIFAFFLIFARFGAAIMLLPAIGEGAVPPRARLALALALTLLVLPSVREGLPPLPQQPAALAALILREVVVGVFLGGAMRLLFSALHVAGVVIGMQSGLSFVQAIDPTQGGQGALVSAFLGLIGVLLVFTTGLHAVLLMGVVDSYRLFPAVGPLPTGDLALAAIELMSSAFAIGVKMAAPFIVYGIVFNLGLGLMQRVMPQLQLFFIVIPIQMALAVALLMFVLSAGMMVFLEHFEAGATAFLTPR